MQCRWTNHALMEASRRGIAMQDVDLVLLLPGQILAVRPGRQVWQSVLTSGYLLRVFVDIDRQPCEIVTVYRTS